jgi:hypothetical protein
MTEDKLDQIIRDAARDYNRPPEIAPREEMWARIQEAQRATAAAPMLRVERGGGPPRASFTQRTQWWALAAAAGILLVAGIGIGRMTSSSPAPSVAVFNGNVQTATTNTPESAEKTAAVTNEPAVETEDAGVVAVSNNRRVASLPTRKGTARSSSSAIEIDAAARSNATYQVASLRHLAETEALLTAFRTDSANRAMDPVVAKWSRDLLSNTRLLLDSPAARDPLRRHLLEDLELVLTQIVQLSNAPNANERDMVESTIRDGHVMTRLRTAIPAGRPQGS